MAKYIVWNSLHTAAGSASWTVIDGMLMVRMAQGTKNAELRGMDPESLARLLMREIAQDAEAA